MNLATPVADVPAIEVRHRGLLMAAVMGASIIQFLDATIANVAVPHMQTQLGASQESVTWVLTSFILALAVSTPLTGWLSERIGSRNLFLLAVTGFLVASALCGTATGLVEMVLFRILQGICAAFIGPLSQTVMLDINPPSKHGRAMAIWGMAVMIAPISGPMLGGWLTENYSWRWVFYINLPIGIPTLAIMWWLLPSRPKSRRRFDLSGYLFLAIGLASLQLMLDRGPHEDWFSSWEIILEGMIAISALWMFAIHMVTAKNPLFSADLIRNTNFLTAMAFMAAMGLAMVALAALLPPLLQSIYGYSVFDTGLLMAPRGLGVLFSMILVQRLTPFIDMRIIIAFGWSVCAFSLWMMTGWSIDMDSREIIVSGLVQGLGLGLVFQPLNLMAFATLPMASRTDGSGLLNLMRNLGGSIGISIITFMLARNIQTSHADLGAHVTDQTSAGFDMSSADRFGAVGDAALTMLDAEINRQAAMIAYLDDFWMMMFVVAAIIPLAFLLKPPKGLPGAPLPKAE